MTSTGMQPGIPLEMAETAVPTLKVMRLQKPELHMVCFDYSHFFPRLPQETFAFVYLMYLYFCFTLYICLYQSLTQSKI